MEKEFRDFLKIFESWEDKEKVLASLKRAWDFAKLAHSGQRRLTGEPYVMHGLETAKILASWKLDLSAILAGLLHDSVEDGAATLKDIEERFGEDVSFLVDGVTKVSNIKLRGSKEEEFVENLRKMFFAMAKDLRVVLVKLADRLHNMRTLYALPKEKRIRISSETIEIYAPLAERLGMGEIKAELDDLAFPYIYPEEFKRVKSESKIYYRKAEEYIKRVKRNLLRSLAEEGIKARIDGRKKHLFSLWKKLERPNVKWDFSKIYDIVALRIIVVTIPECYISLGVVHKCYKPVPHLGISDFIAQPKPNGYQSIHTKVFGPGGKILEIQIRTLEMHRQSEFGIAAHWAYSEVKSKRASKISGDLSNHVVTIVDKLSWVKQLAEWQNRVKDAKEYLQTVKLDTFSKRIFVFSPKGDVFDLPEDATPIDFAYAVHTNLAEYIKTAKVDGKIVPLDFKLTSGQVVEIVKSKNPRPPNPDWLNFVVTSLARQKINQYLRRKS